MPSGMCKICTHLFSVQLTFIKNIIDVASYNSSVFLKQFCHLSLCQPHSLVLQSDINLCLSVLCLINDYLVLFHIVYSISFYPRAGFCIGDGIVIMFQATA